MASGEVRLSLIKAEFSKPSEPKPSAESSEKSGEDEEKGQRKRRNRGQNKNRKRPQRPGDAKRFCPLLLGKLPTDIRSESDCSYGVKCKWHHSRAEFASNKSPDIPNTPCPFFQERGWCPFGIACRAGGTHTEKETLENIWEREKWKAWSEGRERLTTAETNAIPSSVVQLLRQRKYDFKASKDAVAAVHSRTEDKEEVSNRDNNDDSRLEQQEMSELNLESLSKKETRTERKRIDWRGKKYLAPLTTVGNLPFRRICKGFGADVTCGEMTLSTALNSGTMSEWSLVKRHESETIFGAQICGGNLDGMAQAAQLIAENTDVDFIDLNLGCPIDLICNKGGGCALLGRVSRSCHLVDILNKVLEPWGIPLTLKTRTGLKDGKNIAHKLFSAIRNEGAEKISLFTLHGRSKEQRYSQLADWSYMEECAEAADPVPFFGCGDVLSYSDYYQRLENSKFSGIMIARGALMKPWIFQEIDERRDWDISSGERLEMLRRYVSFGLEHWGSDEEGVEKTRRFLLEWLSFLHRYIPVGLLERVPQKMNEPASTAFFGRDELETLMASNRSSDWIKISEILLGPVPSEFTFVPKHKASAY